ncbi:WecB UDP-N-acetylglucosamine 2-epimerase [Candidatus Nanopelagicaceae bacterium]
MTKTKITTLVGTRPELIRLSSIIKRFDEVFEHRLVHTNQNSDPNLLDVFLKDLGIRKPDKNLGVIQSSLGEFLGDLMKKFEEELTENPPHALVILGDTNSALAGIIAKRRGIPVYHLEAGNRSFDSNVPEEINRKIIDHFADFNLAYTERARENLIREGISPRSIATIGSPLKEVLSNNLNSIISSKILTELGIKSKNYFLVSAHRQENIDNNLRLSKLVESLNTLAEKFDLPVIVSLHPRSKNRIDIAKLSFHPLVRLYEPFGFLDYNKLQLEARVVLSDSGSVSEEAVILGFPAITIRDSMERPEALESGCVIMSGITKEGIIEAISILESGATSQAPPKEYLISDTSTRVINFISSTIHQHGFWNGLRNSQS